MRADRRPTGGNVVVLAVDARLFGRVRLLTLDAVVDVAPQGGHRRTVPAAVAPVGSGPQRARRAEAEQLLQDARAALSSRAEEVEEEGSPSGGR